MAVVAQIAQAIIGGFGIVAEIERRATKASTGPRPDRARAASVKSATSRADGQGGDQDQRRAADRYRRLAA